MSDYTPTGNPATDAAGASSDMRAEFALIQTAIATKLEVPGSTSITTLGTIATGTWQGTAVGVAYGGTGRSTGTTAYGLIAAGTTATGAQQTLAAGLTTEILVGGGASALPVWTAATGSGAPVRATSPTLVTPTIGAATATTINTLTVGLGGGSQGSNTAVGVSALTANTTGVTNSSFGYQSLYSNTDGARNSMFGYQAGYSNVSGEKNAGFGFQSLFYATGSYNAGFGWQALLNNTTGSGNTMINPSTSGGTYSPVFDPTTHNDRLVLGSTSVTNAYVQVAWTVVSDVRDKTEIGDVPLGIDFVMAMKPIRYRYREARGSDKAVGPVRYGFSAQDVLALEHDNPVIVDAEDNEKLKLNDSSLIPVLVNAIQHLYGEIEKLKKGN